jgi:4-amino-4-deoxy-L-arabinose transferase-like glycosyltransferase
MIAHPSPRETEFAMRDRVRDYALLLTVSAALTLPNLGSTSLWDMDEGVNAQAAREMRDAGTWVIPTFNYQLRTAKPALLYWLQQTSYEVFGVSEWSARLPSVLAAWLVVLLVYELARRMFTRGTGLLSGIVLASVLQFGMLAHAATPDATLLLFTVLAYFAFWVGHANDSRLWFIPTAAACGLAVLTKGPVGVVMPGLVIFAYFAWNRELSRLLDRRLALAAIAFTLVAGPWYALVASETRGEWVQAFIANENVGRFLNAMDQHGGGLWYYPIAILALFAPWTTFIGATLWYGVKRAKQPAGTAVPGLSQEMRAHRFLVCWVGAYLVFFSAAATKLPNYIFPLVPALAILTARFLILWRDGTVTIPRWLMPLGIGAMAFIGAVFGGLLVYGDRQFPGLAVWGLLGLVLVAGAVRMGWCFRHGDRSGLVTAATVASVVFVGLTVALPPAVVDRQKAPRELVRTSGAGDVDRDLRIATFEWFESSVVFYTGREVEELKDADAVVEFLAVPTPAYLFVTVSAWDDLAARVTSPHRVAARHFDFLRNCDVLVIVNEPDRDVAAK